MRRPPLRESALFRWLTENQELQSKLIPNEAPEKINPGITIDGSFHRSKESFGERQSFRDRVRGAARLAEMRRIGDARDVTNSVNPISDRTASGARIYNSNPFEYTH